MESTTRAILQGHLNHVLYLIEEVTAVRDARAAAFDDANVELAKLRGYKDAMEADLLKDELEKLYEGDPFFADEARPRVFIHFPQSDGTH